MKVNNVSLVGRLTRDPESKQSAGGSGYARFTVAVDRAVKRQDNEVTADFIPCVAFAKTADFVTKYFGKGQRIGLTGHIQTGSYQNKEGRKVYTYDVIADRVEFVEPKREQAQEVPVNDDGFITIPEEYDDLPFV